MLIYISHPYGGKEENKLSVENKIKELVKKQPDDTFISPIHCFGFMYDDVSYTDGVQMCLRLLQVCDMVYMCLGWDESNGCVLEHMSAELNNMPIEYEQSESDQFTSTSVEENYNNG